MLDSKRLITGFAAALLAMLPGASVQAQETAIDGNEFYCVLEPNTEIEISAPVQGVLEEVRVQRGDRIKKGQVLATLLSGVERATVELAEARVEFGKRKAVRNEELYKKKLIAIHDKDEMDTEVQIARLQLKQAEEQLKLCTIRSPIDGVVVERQKDGGEYVESEPLPARSGRLLLGMAETAAERYHSRLRRELLKMDDSQSDLLAFSGRGE